MTPGQKAALEALAGRQFTAEETAALVPLVAAGSTQEIADLLSVVPGGGVRTKLCNTAIGVGTILGAFQGLGGQFMDTLVTIGQTNRDVHWLIEGTIKNGVLNMGDPATRAGIQGLIAQSSMASFVPGMQALLALGVAPDPVSHTQVGEAIKETT